MRGAWKLGELVGIRVQVHWSFAILPLIIGLSALGNSGPIAAVASVLFVLSIFGCVVLHELGHALAARRFGVTTRDITLYPFGGVAALERMPRQPLHELAIALAGPAVNVAIAASIYLGASLAGGLATLALSGGLLGQLLVQLMWTNVALAVFNLLPAFPMDGGRVVRAFLAMRMPYARATEIAAKIGQGMAVLFAIVGLFSNFNIMLMAVALFVFMAARSEAASVRMENASRGIRVGDVMQHHFATVDWDARVADVARQTLFSPQQDFPVVQQGHLLGMLSAKTVLAAMANGDGHQFVGDIVDRHVPTVDRRDTLDRTIERMQAEHRTSVPVSDDGVLVGILPLDQVAKWLQWLAMTGGHRRFQDNQYAHKACII